MNLESELANGNVNVLDVLENEKYLKVFTENDSRAQRMTLKIIIFSLSLASGMFSVALSVALRPPAFHWHLSLRSPDFPLPA